MELCKVRVGGVPEHFNLPWHVAIENESFKTVGVEVEWTDFGGGTGAMCKAIREDEVDVAIMLTEGAIADMIKGNSAKIAQFYVISPLIWGIHVAAKSPYQEVNDLRYEKFAISRIGSGSHLMAYVNAEKRGWNPSKLDFKIIKNLDGARKSLKAGKSAGFMWEKFTTKPLVDNGEFRRIGECPTPWPCFVVVVSEKALKSKKEAIRKMLQTINEVTNSFMNWNYSTTLVAQRYEQRLKDVKKWFDVTTWATSNQVPELILEQVMSTLFALELIPHKVNPSDLCSDLANLTQEDFFEIERKKFFV